MGWEIKQKGKFPGKDNYRIKTGWEALSPHGFGVFHNCHSFCISRQFLLHNKILLQCLSRLYPGKTPHKTYFVSLKVAMVHQHQAEICVVFVADNFGSVL